MKILVNKFIPFHGFVAMLFYSIIFWRKEYQFKMDDYDYFQRIIRHESIHIAQMKDFCKWIPVGGTIFYILYVLEWLFKVLFVYPFSAKAYKNLSFEKEAYKYQYDKDYLLCRQRFAQWRN